MENDVRVWNRLRIGDMEAFATLFEESSDKLYRYGSKFVQDEELIKDCIQDVFVKILQRRDKLPENVANPLSYLFVVLKNTIIDRLTQINKENSITSEELPFFIDFMYDDDDDVDFEIMARFEEVIALLSDRQKEAIYLRYQMNLSYEEISGLLGISYQSTRNLFHRTFEKVRSSIDVKVFILFVALYMK